MRAGSYATTFVVVACIAVTLVLAGDAKSQLPGLPGSSNLKLDELYVDVDELRDEPEQHRYVHGGFKGNDARFSMYFPPRERYGGRFFQPLMAVSGDENTAPMAMTV